MISRVSSFKYLGITLQENLKWNSHIDHICRRFIGISSVMSRMDAEVNHQSRIALYYSMVNSHLTYLHLQRKTVPNHALRKIFGPDYNHNNLSTSEIRLKYKILNVRQLMHQNSLLMILKIDKSLMKCNYQPETEPLHQYSTRNSTRPRLSLYRTNAGKNRIFRASTELYNSLQLSLRNERTLYSFKRKLKINILEMNLT